MSTAVQEQEQVRPAEGTAAEEMQLEKRSAAASIGFGMTARNWDEGLRIARQLATSTLVPKSYQGKPEDIVVAMQLGAEIGLPPMQSLQSIAVINGKPGVYGDGFMAVIMSSPSYAKHDEYYLVNGERRDIVGPKDLELDDTTAVTSFWRKGNPNPFTGTFSVADAKRAKLWGKEGPWANYPARQMRWRARSWAGRDAFAAELRGMGSAEELRDIPPDELEVQSQAIPEPVRRSEKAAAASPTPAGSSAAASQDPVLQTELPPAGESHHASPEKPAREVAATAKSAGRGSTQQKPSASNTGPTVETKSMVITDVVYCTPKGEDPYTEISATVKEQGKAPIGMVFTTRDKALADIAASCEGTDTLVNITWHGATRPNGKACKVLERIVSAS
ncbi:MAG TPA: hypothetical protein VM364_00785 [Vicinamibacterales bacterium]|nr:hypothetical protein [Vicinamibacterales bacterium]